MKLGLKNPPKDFFEGDMKLKYSEILDSQLNTMRTREEVVVRPE